MRRRWFLLYRLTPEGVAKLDSIEGLETEESTRKQPLST